MRKPVGGVRSGVTQLPRHRKLYRIRQRARHIKPPSSGRPLLATAIPVLADQFERNGRNGGQAQEREGHSCWRRKPLHMAVLGQGGSCSVLACFSTLKVKRNEAMRDIVHPTPRQGMRRAYQRSFSSTYRRAGHSSRVLLHHAIRLCRHLSSHIWMPHGQHSSGVWK